MDRNPGRMNWLRPATTANSVHSEQCRRTSGAVAIGEGALRAAVQRGRPGIAVTDPMAAAVQALRGLGLRRLGLITPYSDSVNHSMERYLVSLGFELPARATFRSRESRRLGRTPPTRVTPRAIFEAAVQVGRARVDGIFISCTGLRCSAVIQAIEAAVRKPVVTSNQALAWDCMRLAGQAISLHGFGKLLAGATQTSIGSSEQAMELVTAEEEGGAR